MTLCLLRHLCKWYKSSLISVSNMDRAPESLGAHENQSSKFHEFFIVALMLKGISMALDYQKLNEKSSLNPTLQSHVSRWPLILVFFKFAKFLYTLLNVNYKLCLKHRYTELLIWLLLLLLLLLQSILFYLELCI